MDKETLPKIAVRETEKKLTTGKKITFTPNSHKHNTISVLNFTYLNTWIIQLYIKS